MFELELMTSLQVILTGVQESCIWGGVSSVQHYTASHSDGGTVLLHAMLCCDWAYYVASVRIRWRRYISELVPALTG